MSALWKGVQNKMRKLKFRCFDVDKKIMVEDCSHIQRDGLEVMQFTGLFDKLGREIYEGDIIEYSSRDDCGGLDIWRGSVEFTDCAFQVKLVDGCNFNGSYEFLCDWSECEVIGNIYDNPELLDKP